MNEGPTRLFPPGVKGDPPNALTEPNDVVTDPSNGDVRGREPYETLQASPAVISAWPRFIDTPRHVLSLRRQVGRWRHIVGLQISPNTGRVDV
jgi:hypothetical protein